MRFNSANNHAFAIVHSRPTVAGESAAPPLSPPSSIHRKSYLYHPTCETIAGRAASKPRQRENVMVCLLQPLIV